jgi:hypothetical protein
MSAHTLRNQPITVDYLPRLLVALIVALLAAVFVAVLAESGSQSVPAVSTNTPAALPSAGAGPATQRFVDEVEGVITLSARATATFPETIRTVTNGTADFAGSLDALSGAAGAHIAALDKLATIPAEDAATAHVHALLVQALSVSLDADRAWLAVMDFYATEEVPEFKAAVATADGLTAQALKAQQRFLDAYAVMRANAGRPATQVSAF